MRYSWPNIVLALAISGLPSAILGRAIPDSLDNAPACVGDECPGEEHALETTPFDLKTTGPDNRPGNKAPGSHPDGPPVIPKPDSNPNGMTQVLPMDKYKENGDKARGELDNAIKQKTPDTTVKPEGNLQGQGTYANIKDGYNVKQDFPKGDRDWPELSAVMKNDPELGYVGSANFRERIIQSKATKDETAVTNDCAFDHQNGVIVALRNFAQNDHWPTKPKDPHRLPFSELTFQSLKDSAPRKIGKPSTYDPKNLKLVIRRDVQNEGTRAIVAQAHSDNGIPMTQRGVFELDSKDPKISESFRALSGADNVKGVYYMLKDHHQEIGDKTIKKIYTYPREMEGSNKKLTLALVLG
ncbi:uncharacterized protein ACLA_067060 [Aspergillus clavatus NRRL 1]|uniref:Uncharacterized protein n=1 Tax=Aspergillus clavatus (strain ATCC 1007 / CBS 513.65 / DSM 816 / NCTC 3887 / NRRL 1 / QM 1276 / 107) TaxID=344612 RepID=A1CGJ0_ASPCL|nr:uncharacterized protein ACLA_067060 [Aspergillus clavatus NRRL 1]EAW11070.1 hypothetical protein ACLA_067060 [Aspergillus clavatus NRRL 1]